MKTSGGVNKICTIETVGDKSVVNWFHQMEVRFLVIKCDFHGKPREEDGYFLPVFVTLETDI